MGLVVASGGGAPLPARLPRHLAGALVCAGVQGGVRRHVCTGDTAPGVVCVDACEAVASPPHGVAACLGVLLPLLLLAALGFRRGAFFVPALACLPLAPPPARASAVATHQQRVGTQSALLKMQLPNCQRR